MTDPIETLINDIAIKHRVVIGRNDPILIVQTMNAKLMEDLAHAQQLMLNQYKEELEAIALRWGNATQEKSERILNASLKASKETMTNVLQESAKATSMTVQHDVEKLLFKTEALMLRAKQITLINLSASALTLLAVITGVLGLFR